MTNRFFAGLHPNFGTEGIWLSAAGNDVLNPASSFLLRPELKYEQVILSGSVSLGPGGNVDIFYPSTFTQNPYVFFKDYSSSGFVEYPHSLSLFGGTGIHEVFVGITIGHDRINVFNSSDTFGFFYDFMIFNRSVGA